MDTTLTVQSAVENCHFQSVQCRPGISVCESGDSCNLSVINVDIHMAESFGAFDGMAQKLLQVLFFQTFQDKDLATGQQSGVDLKGWVFRGRTHQNDAALLHIGKKSVLLGFVEPVDLVGEQQGANAHLAVFLRPAHHLFHFFDAAVYSAEFDEVSLGLLCDDSRQSGLAYPRRSPEDHRGNLIFFNQLPQNLTLAYEVLLSHIFV